MLGCEGCGADSPPAVGSGNQNPGVEGRPIQPGTGGMGGSAGAGGEGGSPALGLCDTPENLEALAATPDIGATNTMCSGVLCLNGIGIPPFYRNCVGACVARRVPGLSFECADCYAEVSTCGLNAFCFDVCQFSGCSPQCLNCLGNAGCLDLFAFCSGFPSSPCEDLPPQAPTN